MAKIHNKKIDPKLRRLMSSIDDDNRLKHDITRGFITSETAVDMEKPVSPETLTKRLLVLLRSEEIPSDLSNFQWTKIVGNIFTVEIPITELEKIASSDQVEYIEAGRDLYPSLDSSVPETQANLVHNPQDGSTAFDGAGVVVGIIDLGFDFTLDDFRNDDGTTRVAFIWDQSLVPQAGENSPDGFSYGVEYDEDAINQALNSTDPFSIVRHIPEPASHGTHVAGIASGNGQSGDASFPSGQYIGTAPGATIIFVQPNPSPTIGTFTDSVRVAEAMTYIFNKADELGMPCVINMSLGQNGGSHDGESLVERAIDRLLETPGRAFVVAGGNEHIFRGHSSGTLLTNQNRNLRWKVGGGLPVPGVGTLPPGFGDFTPNEMEIWYSSRDQIRVRVTDPDGDATPFVSPGESDLHNLPSGDRVFIDSERFSVLNGDALIYIEVSPAPFSGSTLKTGVWEVEIESVEGQDGRFDAWIERDARRVLNRFADQSFFVGADFDEVMTLGTPSTSRKGIAVANYNHNIEVPNNSSGRGKTRDERTKPEIAAPGTDIVSSHALGGRNNPNFNPADPNSGPQIFPMRVSMTGTSMSAPHVAGIIALILQKNNRLTAAQIQKILIASANPPNGITPFDVAWGFGKVGAKTAVDLVE